MMWIVIAVFIPLLIPIGFLVFLSRQRRSREHATLEALWEDYSKQGIDASILPEDSPVALEQEKGVFRRLIGFFFGGDIGYIQVRGMNYDLVTVRVAMAPTRTRSSSLGVGPVSYHSFTEEIPVEYHYIVRAGLAGDGIFKARLKRKTKGLFRKEIVGVVWQGGRLATTLNAQVELNMAITHVFALRDNLKVVYDRKHDVVRIILTLPAEMRRKGFLVFFSSKFDQRFPRTKMVDVVDQIGGLIRQRQF